MSRTRWIALLALISLALVPLPVQSALARQSTVDRIDLPVGWQPEGVTTDGRHVFSGSLATGSIIRANPRTGATKLLPRSRTDKPAVGIDYDKRRDIIWVAGGDSGEVRAQRAGSGRLLATYTFPAATNAPFINDLVVTRKAVYATDSMNARIGVVKLRTHNRLPRSGALRTLTLGGEWVQEAGFNANGIVSSHGRLLVIQSNTGKLFNVSPRSGRATQVDVGGADLTSGDGLELDGDILYVVRNAVETVVVVDLDRRLRSGEVVDEISDPDETDVPTTVALVRGSLWAANARFGGTPAEQAAKDYWLTRLPAFDD
jgi:hypothetical protein